MKMIYSNTLCWEILKNMFLIRPSGAINFLIGY